MTSAMLLFFFVVLLANMTEVVAGFGSVLLAVTLGAYLLPVQEIVPMLVPLNILLGMILIFKFHHEIHLKKLFTQILPATLLGMPIGIYLFNYAPHHIIKPMFGGFVLLLASFELWNIVRKKTLITSPLKPAQAFSFLFLGGLIQGLYASGGPPVVYYSAREFKDKSEMRSTLAGLWIILNFILLISLLKSGDINAHSLKRTLLLVPAMVIGFYIGNKLHHRVSELSFKTSIYFLLLVAGLGLLFN